MTRTVASIIGGRPAQRGAGRPSDRAEPGRSVAGRRGGAPGRRRHVRRRVPRGAGGPTGMGGRSARRSADGRSSSSAAWSRRTRRRSSQLLTREIGKPIAESRGEVQEVIDTCNFFLGEGRRLYGQTVPSEMPDKQLFTFRTPVGVAAIITAGNFPVAVPSWYLVPALLCGNAVVWKPAEYTPATAEAFAQLFLHAGFPRRRVQHGPRRRRARRSRGSSARSTSTWSTRSGSPAPPTSGGGSASCAAGTCSRRAWSSAARTRSS